MVENFKELVTDEGWAFIDRLCQSLRDDCDLDVLEEYGITEFRGGSLGRRVLPFPDSLVREGFLESTELDSFYVIKASGQPLPHNYREIMVWKRACDLGWEHEALFAPIHVWGDDDFSWLLMRRVTPVSPVKNDVAYLQTGQEYVYSPDVPERVEEKLTELGWTVEDVEMNLGMLRDGFCLMDYGGVDRQDQPIEVPEWIRNSPES